VTDRIDSVLFLCTGNSAGSIMAGCILSRAGFGRFQAGSHPAAAVHPSALRLLERLNHPTTELRPKDGSGFAGDDAPRMDVVITVCEGTAGELCPAWPGRPMSAHWGFPDPAAVEGSDTEKALAFSGVFKELSTRIDVFASLPIASLDRLTLQRRLDELAPGMTGDAVA
jgi:arsenate reductase